MCIMKTFWGITTDGRTDGWQKDGWRPIPKSSIFWTKTNTNMYRSCHFVLSFYNKKLSPQSSLMVPSWICISEYWWAALDAWPGACLINQEVSRRQSGWDQATQSNSPSITLGAISNFQTFKQLSNIKQKIVCTMYCITPQFPPLFRAHLRLR